MPTATKPKIMWDVIKQSKRYQAAMDGRVLAVVYYDDRASASLFPWRIRATWTHQDWPEYDTLEGAQRRVERAYAAYQEEQAARRVKAAPRMKGLFDGLS